MFDLYADRLAVATYDMLQKNHLLLHLWDRVPTTGNPRTFASSEDESRNRQLAVICKSVYALHFNQRVLTYSQKRHALDVAKRKS